VDLGTTLSSRTGSNWALVRLFRSYSRNAVLRHRESVTFHCKESESDRYPDYSGSRAVSLGACLYIIQNPVASRISNDWIGIAHHREAQPWEILDRPDLVYDHFDGTKHLEAFLPIKAKAQIVEQDNFFSHRCHYEYKSRPLQKESRTIKLFRSSQDKAPLYSGDTDLELIGTVRLEVNPKMPSEVVEIRAGVRRYKCKLCSS
jgi:hypothetical protein